jgi:hypothetical protein
MLLGKWRLGIAAGTGLHRAVLLGRGLLVGLGNLVLDLALALDGPKA